MCRRTKEAPPWHEHGRFVALARAEDLVRRKGLRLMYRSPRAFEEAVAQAERLKLEYGIAFDALDTHAMALAEPALRMPVAGVALPPAARKGACCHAGDAQHMSKASIIASQWSHMCC